VLISGDQVLPRISSNVSVFPTEPEADPLTDWLTSLAKVKATVPDSVLVLPAHNDPFHGLHARIDHLIGGHERGLSRLEKKIAEPRRVVDVFGALFARPIGPDLLGMATGEALAHLNCLIGRGLVTRRTDAEGVAWYGSGRSSKQPFDISCAKYKLRPCLSPLTAASSSCSTPAIGVSSAGSRPRWPPRAV
jgi:hypothetical protein